ncbi:MAG: hypothetical protein U5K74_05565 [Gemmatimonadaceae bacterium]|nr:hypothetical protein [Gemmatimonadaceae bacterium]
MHQASVLPVLLVESRASPFLTRALAIGDAPRFDVLNRTPGRVSAADLSGRRLVILADGAFPTGIGASRLLDFVRSGGGLIVALSEQANPRLWPTAAGDLVPGAIRAISDRSGGSGAVLGSLDQNHPALALLTGTHAGDLAAARFYRYRGIDTTAGVLARFDDGAAALSEHSVGRGRVLTFGSGFDGLWNDLPRQPAFLPLVQQLARYASGWRELPRAFEIGSSVRPSDLLADDQPQTTRWIASSPSGVRIAVGGADAPAALEFTEAGVHELRPGGSPGARPLLAAANVAPAELDFASFDVLRLTSALVSVADSNTVAGGVAEVESLSDREARQSTWWYLLLAAALLLAAESLVARRGFTRAPGVE